MKRFSFSPTIALALFLIISGAIIRVLRHHGILDLPPNVAPVSAMAMFSAVALPRRWSMVIPLALMLASDIAIGFDFWPITAAVYACFLLSATIGGWMKRRFSLVRVAIGTFAGSIAFFLVTNAAVWLFTDMYAPGLAGLGNSYVAGLPYFRNTVLGDAAYATVFFGLYAVAAALSRRAMTRNVPAA